MKASKAQCEAIKLAISDGTTSTSTVSALQTILGLDTRPATSSSISKAAPRTLDARKPASRKAQPKKCVPDTIRDDADDLSAKERYVLATETVNICLKLLSAASKDKAAAKALAGSDESSRTSTLTCRKIGERTRVLQPTSGNASPKPTAAKPAAKKQTEGHEAPECTSCIVQCARLAFSYLKSTEAKGISNATNQASWQLDSGLIAFAGKLMVLELDFMPELSMLRCALLPRQSKPRTSEVARSEDKSAMVFELQMLALRLKQLSSKSDASLEAFHRPLETYRRQSQGAVIRHYDLVAEFHELLGVATAIGNQEIRFDILRTFATAAEACGKADEALAWTMRMQEACGSLGEEHARHVACVIKRLRLSSDEIDASHLLYKQTNGRAADYDMLLEELACYVSAKNGKVSTEMSRAAARYAQRYARSYQDRNLKLVQTLIQSALSSSGQVDEIVRWVALESARVYYRIGTLRRITDAAARTTMAKAWSTNTEAVALSRILQALLWQAAGMPSSDGPLYLPFGESDALSDDEKAVLLHRAVLDMPEPKKSRPNSTKILEHILTTLSVLYNCDKHPLRRTTAATHVLRLQSMHDLQPGILESWAISRHLDATSLADDDSLRRYLLDVQTVWHIAKLFHDGRPDTAQLLDFVTRGQSLSGEEDMYDQEATTSQLQACATYLDMIGDDYSRLRTLQLQRSLSKASAAVDLAGQNLRMGHAEKALALLAEVSKIRDASKRDLLGELGFGLALAECHVATGNFVQAEADLARTKEMRELLPPERVSRGERKSYELLHARAWFVRSKLCLATGSAKSALAAAKRSVKLLQATWAAAERASGEKPSSTDGRSQDETDSNVPDVNALATGVSKLQLTPKDKQEQQPHEISTKGAAFWPIVSPICQALMHLSDLYAHHGVFAEADYYSERAIKIAEPMPSTHLLARIRLHRSRLLVLAGQLEAAELCLTKSKEGNSGPAPLDMVSRRCAEAELCTKEGSLEEAVKLYQAAADGVQRTRSPELTRSDEQTDARNENAPALAVRSKRPVATRPANGKGIISKAGSKRPAKAVITETSQTLVQQIRQPCIVLDDKLAHITTQHALVLMRLGRCNEASTMIAEIPAAAPQRSSQRHYEHRKLMHKAVAIFEADVTFSMLSESTLACPAVLPVEKLKSNSNPSAKSRSARTSTPEHAIEVLGAARQCLVPKAKETVSKATVTVHHDASLLADATMYLASIGTTNGVTRVHPARAASQVEYPRTHAYESELATVEVDIEVAESTSPFQWPLPPEAHNDLRPLNAAQFQEQFVDILPAPWTAVSLYLNDECTELYAVRYRAGQSPLILRLPFSRHKPDDEDEEPFDYNKGRSELQDIIAASNYSCHNTKGMEGKGAKSSWWTEREALDRRLHELLLNVENIWFGGFKGIFSQQARHAELLARFRKSFDDILLRHLPSRQSAKVRTDLFTLDGKVLELFTGLSGGEDDAADNDEPLTDLLYFVVDMLQFSGEHNAYDEIDFDSMVVDVQDALRSYHDSLPQKHDEARHTILILDKRLQAFPWESLPCLETVSVSRVGSMQSLRERILAMKHQHQKLEVNSSCYVVDRKSGTYILNPSNDLANTQSTLQEPLAKLANAHDAKWTAMVQQAPKEEEFKQALTDSSMMLYFGHGAGSQYIRPRTIRKLEKCSEVVWLMGCSSGAITEYGELEPFAVPFAYLMAGDKHDDGEGMEQKHKHGKCMAVIGTLWDVTDKDIDRFSLAVGEEWGLWAPSEASKLPAKTPKKAQRYLIAPSTPQQVPKTPKTPRVGKTPAAAGKTPARSRSRSKPRQSDGRKRSLVEAVSRSRDACYLRYLNGAAPVVYGVPVYLGD